MKNGLSAVVVIAVVSLFVSAAGQTPIVINIPGEETENRKLTDADRTLIERSALPKVRKKLADDACQESFEPAGVVQGSFSKPNSDQRLVYYQFCQTGNGLGQVGLILIEGGRVVGNYVADVGWSVGVKALPDINRNGFDEVALYYSGGMHQGAGGTGVDVIEFTGSGVKGIGWFQAESFGETTPVVGYRVTARPGKVPAFFREKYVQNAAGKWRKIGAVAPLRLQKAVSVFTPVR